MKRIYVFIIFAVLLAVCACSGDAKKGKAKTKRKAKADTLVNALISSYEAGNFIEAQNIGEKALTVFLAENDTASLYECYNNLCTSYFRTGDTKKALEMGFKALEIDSIRKDYEAMGSDNNNVACIYLSMQDVENAKIFTDKALEMDRISGTNRKESAHLGIACEVYNQLGEHTQALEFAAMAYKMDREKGDSLNMARRLSQMADVYCNMGEYGKAERNYIESNALMKNTPEDLSKCINYKQLGNVYMKTGRPNDAEIVLEKSLAMAEKKQVKYLMLQDLEKLAELYKTKKPEVAVKYMQQANALKDSIYNEQTNRLKENYATMYKSSQKQETIKKQESQLEMHRMVLWGVAVVVVLLLFLCGALFYISRLRSQQQRILNRMNTIRQNFFKNITHEFRTPLTVIKGRADKMKQEEDDKQKISGYDAIIEQSDVMLCLVNQLIDISKVYNNDENKLWRSGDAVAMTQMVVENMRTHAEKKLVTLEF